VGVSALRALLEMSSDAGLYELAMRRNSVELPRWEGVVLVASDMRLAATLPEADFEKALEKLRRNHVLAVVDLAFPHPLWGKVVEAADLVVLVTLLRRDALKKAGWLLEEIRERGKEVRVVFNRTRWADRLLAAGIERDADLPEVGNAHEYPPRLGDAVLRVIYPGW